MFYLQLKGNVYRRATRVNTRVVLQLSSVAAGCALTAVLRVLVWGHRPARVVRVQRGSGDRARVDVCKCSRAVENLLVAALSRMTSSSLRTLLRAMLLPVGMVLAHRSTAMWPAAGVDWEKQQSQWASGNDPAADLQRKIDHAIGNRTPVLELSLIHI